MCPQNSHQDHHFFERHLGRPGRLRSSRHENLIVPKNKVKAEERVFLTLDEVDRIFDKRGIMIKELEVAILEKIKRDRYVYININPLYCIAPSLYIYMHCICLVELRLCILIIFSSSYTDYMQATWFVCRRIRLLVRGSIFVGLAVYVKKHFFGGSSQEANKGMTESN